MSTQTIIFSYTPKWLYTLSSVCQQVASYSWGVETLPLSSQTSWEFPHSVFSNYSAPALVGQNFSCWDLSYSRHNMSTDHISEPDFLRVALIFFVHIPSVVNCTFNTMLTERLQQQYLSFLPWKCGYSQKVSKAFNHIVCYCIFCGSPVSHKLTVMLDLCCSDLTAFPLFLLVTIAMLFNVELLMAMLWMLKPVFVLMKFVDFFLWYAKKIYCCGLNLWCLVYDQQIFYLSEVIEHWKTINLLM